MEKYIESLEQLPFNLLHIAQSYATDNKSPYIEPAHLLRALLHKNAGLVNYIEDALHADYYYMVDWSDMRIQQCDKSPYRMKGYILSESSKTTIREAINISQKYGYQELQAKALLAAILTPGIAFTYEQLKTMPLKAEDIVISETSSDTSNRNNATNQIYATNVNVSNKGCDYCLCLWKNEPNNKIIGFDTQLRYLIEVLARKDRANILIIGESGVGKSSLVEAFLTLLNENKLPDSLSNAHPFELDLISLSQGISYKGEIEDRFKDTINYLLNFEQPILIIDKFHTIEDKSSVLSGILPILSKILSKNQIQLICTTTVDGFTKDIEKDKEILSYLEKIRIEEPSEDLATQIINIKCETYEKFHHVKIGNGVSAEIVRLAKRYMAERKLPASALDLLDRSMASVKIEKELSNASSEDVQTSDEILDKEDVRNIVSKMTGIPMGNIQSEERQKLSNAEEILHNRVVGQNHAIRSVLDAIYESRSGLSKKGQPIGSFFFLGPTGTGKTELAKALAEFLFDDETSILRFDMSEYKEEHSVALLYGAPPGYVGYEEGGLLVNQIRQHPYSVVLFDEIEKAHKSVFDLFLQILDEGKLHDRLGRLGDFSNSLIIFTSNIGSEYIFKSFGEKKIPTHDQMLEIMQGSFRPEFLARLTEIIPFSPITNEMIDKIFDIHIINLLKTLKEQNIELKIDESARQYITKVGFNAHYGARPILGIIRKEIRRPLSKLIISGDIEAGDTVIMKYNESNKEICWEINSNKER